MKTKTRLENNKNNNSKTCFSFTADLFSMVHFKQTEIACINISGIQKKNETMSIICIGVWGCESNREIVFFSFVGACEAACGGGTMLLPRLGCGSSQRTLVWRVAFRALRFAGC